MANPLYSDKYYRLWVMLHWARDTLVGSWTKELSQYGISPEHAAVLFIIDTKGNNVTPAEISRWLLRKPNTVSGLLNRMAKKGLVQKTRDLDKKNLVRVSLTEKGQELFHKSTNIKSIREVFSSLSEKERQQLYSYLEIVRNKSLERLGINHNIPFP